MLFGETSPLVCFLFYYKIGVWCWYNVYHSYLLYINDPKFTWPWKRNIIHGFSYVIITNKVIFFYKNAFLFNFLIRMLKGDLSDHYNRYTTLNCAYNYLVPELCRDLWYYVASLPTVLYCDYKFQNETAPSVVNLCQLETFRCQLRYLLVCTCYLLVCTLQHFKVYLYPKIIFWHVKDICFSGPLHQHLEKKVSISNEIIPLHVSKNTMESMGLKEKNIYKYSFVFRNHQKIKELE